MVIERVFEIDQHPLLPAQYPEILDEQILAQNGSYRKVKQYLKGWHPDLGKLHMGWQGKETIIERDVISPVRTFTVTEVTRTYGGLQQLTRQPHLYIVKVTTKYLNQE